MVGVHLGMFGVLGQILCLRVFTCILGVLLCILKVLLGYFGSTCKYIESTLGHIRSTLGYVEYVGNTLSCECFHI